MGLQEPVDFAAEVGIGATGLVEIGGAFVPGLQFESPEKDLLLVVLFVVHAVLSLCLSLVIPSFPDSGKRISGRGRVRQLRFPDRPA